MRPPDDPELGIATDPAPSRDETGAPDAVVDLVAGDLEPPEVDEVDEVGEIDDAVDAHIVLPGDDIEILPDAVEPAPAPAASRVPRPPAVDPRIRARRIAVAREQGRKRLRVLLVAMAVFVVAGTGWLVVHSPFLDVDHVVVTGVPPGRVAAIVAASGVHRRDPLMLLSTGAVVRRLDRYPGIGSARVTRDYPGTVRISVKQLGVAAWVRAPAGGVALVGFDGRVQQVAPAPPANVIELRGLKSVPPTGGRIAIPEVVGVLAQFPPAFAQRVGAISAAGRGDVRVYLKVGGEVRLGDTTLLHSKGAVAEALLERMDCAVLYVDVSSVANPVAMPAPGAHCNA